MKRNNMKLISRKAITATIAAAAISTASLTAPAMAETPTNTDKSAWSSSSFFPSEKDGKKLTTGEQIAEIVKVLSGIGALFGALITINNNIANIIKSFKI